MKSNRATLTTPLLAALAALAVCAAPAFAGVVYEIEVTDHGASAPSSETFETAVDGKNLAMGVAAGGRGGPGEMIFRGERREMVVVDHDDKSYSVIDEEAIESILGQLSQVSKQMEEALKNVPEDQRAMVEKMMKERMPNAAAPAAPTTSLRNTGERGERAGYPCVKYEVLRDGRKVRELWVTDWDNVTGGDEVAGAFESMAEFFGGFRDALRNSPIGQMGGGEAFDDNMFEQMKELNGFPVVTREFDDAGNLESESTLRSANRRTLDPADFEPPAGYKRRQMFGGN